MILVDYFSPLKSFKKWGQNLHFYVSEIAFQLVIFQYLESHLTQIVYLPHCRIIIESFKC